MHCIPINVNEALLNKLIHVNGHVLVLLPNQTINLKLFCQVEKTINNIKNFINFKIIYCKEYYSQHVILLKRT